tara:strand:+ start:411 stop:1139 length:729 start_codon:yes stop_codon:yes gene_type:complete
MSNKIGFILIKPQLGENIGASARALKNFGFNDLIISNPRDSWPNTKANATSVGAFDILKKTKVYERTEDAIKSFDLIFSFSARKRDVNKKHLCFDTFLQKIRKIKNKKIGLMFGPEASGLSNSDLSYSNYVVQIPSAPKFSSLNLSHSIIIVCYEIFRIKNKNQLKQKKFVKHLGQKGKLNEFMKLLRDKLNQKKFFNPKEKKNSMITNINNLFYRMDLNDKEIRILASIIGTLGKNKKKHN